MAWSTDRSSAAHAARRAVLRSGPGALSRLIGHPAVAAAMRQQREAPPAPDGPPAEEPVEARPPLIDLFDEGHELLVVADLPGAVAGQVLVWVEGGAMVISQPGAGYHARQALPAAVEAASLRVAVRNGILEARVAKR